ncbi:MAG TPA: flagellar hook assembly protein FlgD [Rhodoblastus sp.]|nr:flagellar hook assembly protein FlgD [Rhodoblastus sp.]
MQLSAPASTPAAATGAQNVAGSGVSTLGYNDFLQLLMAQMRNQDPTAPTDSTQWVSQLATFSSVEQAVQANSKLDQILQNTSLTDAEALLGRKVSSLDGSVSGVVTAVTILNGGLVATLDNGAILPISSDVTIS